MAAITCGEPIRVRTTVSNPPLRVLDDEVAMHGYVF